MVVCFVICSLNNNFETIFHHFQDLQDRYRHKGMHRFGQYYLDYSRNSSNKLNAKIVSF